MIVSLEAQDRFVRLRTMKQATYVRCDICGREAVKAENKLDGACVAYCVKHRRPREDLHDLLRRIRLKQAARKFLHKKA